MSNGDRNYPAEGFGHAQPMREDQLRAPAAVQQQPLRDAVAAQAGGEVMAPAASAAAMAAAQGEPFAGDDETTVEFSRAYTAHGESVHRVRFRTPTGKDIMRLGNPVRFVPPRAGEDDIEINVIASRVGDYIVALSEPPLPKSTVGQFEIVDFNACSQVITAFFTKG